LNSRWEETTWITHDVNSWRTAAGLAAAGWTMEALAAGEPVLAEHPLVARI
jgi:heme-degrading monooxygenase HmoA